MSASTVEYGSWVKVAGLIPGAETVIRFVRDHEVHYAAHRVPHNSLLGEALIGAQAGDRVLLNASHDPVELAVLATGPA